jgi:hypothetical protein
MTMANPPTFINLSDLTGVDAETYQAADSGDRQAQKLILRNLLTREASAESLTTGHWTDWMLRQIATGARQAICDLLGSISEAERGGGITQAQASALNELIEQYLGPGSVGEGAAGRALGAFGEETREGTVVQLFLIADALASGEEMEPQAMRTAAEVCDALKSPGAASFFRAVWAQHTCRQDPRAAFGAVLEAAKALEPLAEEDAVYRPKLGQLAILGSQIAEMTGEPQAGVLLRTIYAERVEQYLASEKEGF